MEQFLADFTAFDKLVLVIVGFSSFVGLTRGLSGEIASLLKLALASIVAGFVAQYAAIKFGNDTLYGNVAVIAITSVAGIISLYFLKLITMQIAVILGALIPSIIDKPLGLGVGFIKGGLISLVIYMVSVKGADLFKMKEPEWLQGSKTTAYLKPYMEKADKLINLFFPDEENKDDKKSNSLEKLMKNSDKIDDLNKNLEKKGEGDTAKRIKDTLSIIDMYNNMKGDSEEGDKNTDEKKSVDDVFENIEGILNSLE